MFRKDTIQAISMVLLVTMTLYGTGIVDAASFSVSEVPEQSDPWVPLTDSEMEQIEGGWVLELLTGLILLATVVVMACEIRGCVRDQSTVKRDEYEYFTEDTDESSKCYQSRTIVYENYGSQPIPDPGCPDCTVDHTDTETEEVSMCLC